ncbi:MAG: hypothetical protein K6F76_03905 [Clostridiales bacterium]|nr:hypothetical protein [Clostridiales bacterium]
MPDMFNKGEYDFLQREAQNRVYKMRENGKKAAPNQSQNNKNDAKLQKESNVITQGMTTKAKNQENTVVKHGSLNLMDMIMKDKERSLIILLIILLSQENSNPGLILSLIYLLI